MSVGICLGSAAIGIWWVVAELSNIHKALKRIADALEERR